jgi:succinate-acetate transporter protein
MSLVGRAPIALTSNSHEQPDSHVRQDQHASSRAAVFLRPLGTPLPLAFVGLMVASAVLSCFDLGWIPRSEQAQVGLVLISFAVPLQGLATVLLFMARDAPSGASIGVLSVTWLSYGLLLVESRSGSRSATAAVLLFAAAAALAPGAVTSALSKLIPAAVLAAASLRLLLTGLYEKLGSTGWKHASGWEGLILAAAALYAALASDLEGSTRRDVLPLGRRGAGRRALEETIDDQGDAIEKEPGVRSRV